MRNFDKTIKMKYPKKFRLMFAAGMLIMFGSMAVHVFVPMHDFVYGLLQGLGIALMIATLYRVKRNTAAGKN